MVGEDAVVRAPWTVTAGFEMSGLHLVGPVGRQGGGGEEAHCCDGEGPIGELPAVQLAGAGEATPHQHARAFGEAVVGRQALG